MTAEKRRQLDRVSKSYQFMNGHSLRLLKTHYFSHSVYLCSQTIAFLPAFVHVQTNNAEVQFS